MKPSINLGVDETKYKFRCRDVPWNVSTLNHQHPEKDQNLDQIQELNHIRIL